VIELRPFRYHLREGLMASRRAIFLVSFLMTLAAVPALVQSLDDRKMHADQEAQLA
jgi:hypothetical protein